MDGAPENLLHGLDDAGDGAYNALELRELDVELLAAVGGEGVEVVVLAGSGVG